MGENNRYNDDYDLDECPISGSVHVSWEKRIEAENRQIEKYDTQDSDKNETKSAPGIWIVINVIRFFHHHKISHNLRVDFQATI